MLDEVHPGQCPRDACLAAVQGHNADTVRMAVIEAAIEPTSS